MKKVFISVPIRNRKWDDVLNSIEKLKEYAKEYLKEDIVVVSDIIKAQPPQDTKESLTGLWYLGESLKLMSFADFVIGVTDSKEYGFNGCQIEMDAARYYHISNIEIPILEICPDLSKHLKNFA